MARSWWLTSVPGYAGWAVDWGVDIGSETNAYDLEGLLNIYEYGLGGDPTNSNDQGTSPAFAIVDGGGSNMFNYVYALKVENEITFRQAAYRVAVQRVADSNELRGIYP